MSMGLNVDLKSKLEKLIQHVRNSSFIIEKHKKRQDLIRNISKKLFDINLIKILLMETGIFTQYSMDPVLNIK